MEAKKKAASVFSGREEDIDKGLFGVGGEVGGPEDTITKVSKSNPYTGQHQFLVVKWMLRLIVCATVWLL